MPIFNYKTREMIVKIVYYGAGLCGKTTSLQYLHQHTIDERRGELYFLATETDQTIYFELLPLFVGELNNFKLRFQVYTVPGQVKYNNTRKIVLQGADAIVFVADSQRSRREANIISFKNLRFNLEGGYNRRLQEIPLVYEYNKRDMEKILSLEELDQDINPWNRPFFQTVAPQGTGVLDAFEAISTEAIANLENRRIGQVEEKNSRAQAGHDKSAAEAEPIAPETPRQRYLLSGDEDYYGDISATEGPILAETDEAAECVEKARPLIFEESTPSIPVAQGTEHEKEISYLDIVTLSYNDGDVIFEEGTPGDEMYFIEEGKVDIISSYKGAKKTVMTYEKGEFFGEMVLFGGKTRSASAMAVGRTRLLPITKKTLWAQIPKKPQIAVGLLEALSQRLRKNTKIINELATQNKDLVQQLKKTRDLLKQLKEQHHQLQPKQE